MTELYLVRHGETELNVKGVYYGWTDCSLNEKGIRQAEALKEIFKDIVFDVVISSSLKRAVETASIIAACPVEDIILDERLRELHFGEWEGIHYSEIREKHKEDWERWGQDWKNTSPPSGESFRDMYNRVRESLNELLNKYKDKKILMVSHQGCLRIIPMILLKLNEEGYWSFTAEQGKYSLFQIDEKGHCIVRKVNCGKD